MTKTLKATGNQVPFSPPHDVTEGEIRKGWLEANIADTEAALQEAKRQAAFGDPGADEWAHRARQLEWSLPYKEAELRELNAWLRKHG